MDEREVSTNLSITNLPWTPDRDYEEFDIDSLELGPRCVTFQGRIANFYDQSTPSKRPRAAKGCVKILMKDENGLVLVSF